MKVLAIETATAVCSIAVVENGVVLGERSFEERQMHSEKIIALIDQSLRASSLTMKEIEGLAISIGPGSFTGLRIGLSTAKGIGCALGIPLAAVSTLEALASRVVGERTTAEGSYVLAAIDARRDEVYAAGYRMKKKLEEQIRPCAIEARSLIRLVGREPNVLLVGDGAEKLVRSLSAERSALEDQIRLAPPELRRCSATMVGILGEQQLRRGMHADIASLEPMYVKEFYTTVNPQPFVHV